MVKWWHRSSKTRKKKNFVCQENIILYQSCWFAQHTPKQINSQWSQGTTEAAARLGGLIHCKNQWSVDVGDIRILKIYVAFNLDTGFLLLNHPFAFTGISGVTDILPSLLAWQFHDAAIHFCVSVGLHGSIREIGCNVPSWAENSQQMERGSPNSLL